MSNHFKVDGERIVMGKPGSREWLSIKDIAKKLNAADKHEAENERLKNPRKLTPVELCELMDTVLPEVIEDDRDMQRLIIRLYPLLVELYSKEASDE